MGINGIGTEVKGLQCPRCKDIIYSRANHDFRRCSCNGIFVDGGQHDYSHRAGAEVDLIGAVVSVTLTVDATPAELFEDWNKGIDKFGCIAAPGVPNPVKGLQLTLYPIG